MAPGSRLLACGWVARTWVSCRCGITSAAHDLSEAGVVASELGDEGGGGRERDALVFHPPQRDVVSHGCWVPQALATNVTWWPLPLSVKRRGQAADFGADLGGDQLMAAAGGECLGDLGIGQAVDRA